MQYLTVVLHVFSFAGYSTHLEWSHCNLYLLNIPQHFLLTVILLHWVQRVPESCSGSLGPQKPVASQAGAVLPCHWLWADPQVSTRRPASPWPGCGPTRQPHEREDLPPQDCTCFSLWSLHPKLCFKTTGKFTKPTELILQHLVGNLV